MDLSTKNAEFLGRMEVLNKSLMKFLFKSLEEFPGADLTPTINSYLKHVSDLDKKYSGGSDDQATNTASKSASASQTTKAYQPISSGSNRKRAMPSSNELRSFADKRPKESEKDARAREIVAELKRNAQSEQQRPEKRVEQRTEPAQPTSNFSTVPNFFQHKDVVVEQTKDTGFEQPSPNNFPNFFQHKDVVVEQTKDTGFEQQPSKMPNFFKSKVVEQTKDTGFEQVPAVSTNTSFNNDAPKKIEGVPSNSFLFGGSNTSGGFSMFDNNKSGNFLSNDTSKDVNKSSVFPSSGKSLTFPSTTQASSPMNFSLFGNTSVNGGKSESRFSTPQNHNGKELSTILFSTPKTANESKSESKTENKPESKTDTCPPFQFNQKPAESSTAYTQQKPVNFPSFQFNQNGKEASTTTFSTPSNTDSCPPFQFTPTAAESSTASSQQNGVEQEADENEEPPKVEDVEQQEEGALLSMKTAVFTYKEKKWEKLGIAYVNVMPGEKDNRVLVRAATTLGSIWINTYIAEHFKAFLKGEKAMTIRFPDVDPDGKTLIVQYLFKGGDPEDFKKLAELLKANVLK